MVRVGPWPRCGRRPGAANVSDVQPWCGDRLTVHGHSTRRHGMSEFTRREFHATLAGLALPASGVALAQDRFPSKPVKNICPFAPGGGSDFMARVAAGVLGERLSQSAIVDMSGALDPAIQKKLLTAASMPPPCSRATATSTGASTPMPNRPSWPRRRWSWPTRSRARCASTSRTTCWPWWMAGRYACRICGPTTRKSTPWWPRASSPRSTARCTNPCSPFAAMTAHA